MKKSSISIIVIIVLVFLGMMLANGFGYYESTLNKKTVFTNEKIKEFEEDIKEGKEVDLSSYIEINSPDYDNSVSEFSLSVSRIIEKTFSKGMNFIFRKISSVMEE